MKNIKHFVLAISLLGAGSARAIGFAPIVGYFMPKVANPTRWEQFVALLFFRLFAGMFNFC